MKKTATPRKKKASPVAKLKAELARVTQEREMYRRAILALMYPELEKCTLTKEELMAQVDTSISMRDLLKELGA
ncbi:MAG: hypothetical protein L0Y72_02295 [Gemmataceae bacterium]|nr:hypothetical protein [Gemmataceae bacterium]MCI0737846.1 hypothetical protein [Gemmataceae bacterium]